MLETLKTTVEFESFIYNDTEDEVWIGKVLINGEEFRVYADNENIEVKPSGTAKRSTFGWNDWIFDNVEDEVGKAMCIAALAVALSV